MRGGFASPDPTTAKLRVFAPLRPRLPNYA